MAEVELLRADRADIDAYRTQPFLFKFVERSVKSLFM
jgi:hypothetical protein